MESLAFSSLRANYRPRIPTINFMLTLTLFPMFCLIPFVSLKLNAQSLPSFHNHLASSTSFSALYITITYILLLYHDDFVTNVCQLESFQVQAVPDHLVNVTIYSKQSKHWDRSRRMRIARSEETRRN